MRRRPSHHMSSLSSFTEGSRSGRRCRPRRRGGLRPSERTSRPSSWRLIAKPVENTLASGFHCRAYIFPASDLCSWDHAAAGAFSVGKTGRQCLKMTRRTGEAEGVNDTVVELDVGREAPFGELTGHLQNDLFESHGELFRRSSPSASIGVAAHRPRSRCGAIQLPKDPRSASCAKAEQFSPPSAPSPGAPGRPPQRRLRGPSRPDSARVLEGLLAHLHFCSGVYEFVFAPGCCYMWTCACVLTVHTSANVYVFARACARV